MFPPNKKIRRFTNAIFAILCSVAAIGVSAQTPVYKDASQPIDARVKDLLSRMTLEEKAWQMVAVDKSLKKEDKITEDGEFDVSGIKALFKHGAGQVTRLSEAKGAKSQTADGAADEKPLGPIENAKLSNAVQKYFVEETRLGIPVIIHEECLHGLVALDATSYPHPIAMAGIFDTELVEKVYSAIAEETRARGGHQALTPVVDIARDARWGRVEETYGEDPYLTAQMGIAAINGFQGDRTFDENKKIVATLKHFAAHGQPASGTNTAPANYSERILREVHYYPFKEVIQKAGALSVMTTYNEIDGVPINANRELVTGILREEWGFKGFVVSDYYSIREMHERDHVNTHRVARDGKEAALLALNAGVNIELPNPDTYKHIPELVRSGKITMAAIDTLVGEMLRVKFMLGLFDNPYINPMDAKNLHGNAPDRKALAREVARKSATLLENNGVLPLNLDKIKTIAVIGPNADRAMPGGYTGEQPYHVTVLEGIKNHVGDKVKVLYEEGVGITRGGSWVEDKVTYSDPKSDKKGIKRAVKIAKKADVVILALGGNEQTAREAWNNLHMGDRTSLQLVGMQDELVNALKKTKTPIVSVVFSGRPLAYNNLAEKSDALFQAWYLGQESGNAIADLVFGDFNPSAKLPITFPRSVGHLPVYYNHKPSERRGYLDAEITPLYAFGYGLSYTDFDISEPKLNTSSIAKNGVAKVSVDVKNTGKVEGEEAVQLYIRDQYSSVTRPVKELKGFEKVSLKPGESKTVTFEITPELLSFYDINMDFTVESGKFNIMVGSSSRDEDLKTTVLTVL